MLPHLTKSKALLLCVGLACLAIYTLHAGNYLIFDSYTVLQANAAIRIDGARMDDWRIAALSTNSGVLGRPLSMLSFALDHVLSGDIYPLYIKFVNACLHLVIAVCTALFLQLLGTASPVLGWTPQRAAAVAALAALLWLLHPLHVSTVLYAVQRMTQLAMLFSILGLYLWFRQRRTWLDSAPSPEAVSRSVFVLLLMTLLAGLSKENGLLLPWLVAITELCLFRFVVAGRVSTRARNLTLGLLLAPFVGLVLLLVLAPGWAEGSFASRDFGMLERVLTQTRVLWNYILWLLLPMPGFMSLYHDDIALARSLVEPLVVLALLAWVSVGAIAWRYRQRWPLLGFALLWYLFAHSMESSVLALEMVFEHRNYLPSVGVLFFVAGALWPEAQSYRAYRGMVAGVLVTLLACSLFWRSSYWRSETELAEHHYAVHPKSLRSHFHLASRYQQEGIAATEVALAQRYFRAARSLALNALTLDQDSIPALVLLIYFDGNSDDPGQITAWYERLQAAVAKPKLDVADIKFIEFQNSCVINGECRPPPAGQYEMLSRLASANRDHALLRYQLPRYCLAVGDLDCARVKAEQLLIEFPGFAEALALVYASDRLAGNPQQIQASLRRMVEQDDQRRLTREPIETQGGVR